MSDHCELCDLPLAWCQHGNSFAGRIDPPTRPGGARGMGPIFQAAYSGRCICGDSGIEPGDDVRYIDGELCLVGCCAEEDDNDYRSGSMHVGLGFTP